MKKKLLAVMMAAVLAVTAATSTVSAASVSDMTDVKPGDWFYPYVQDALERNLFNGTSETTFSPKGTMTRGMMVTTLANMANIDKSQYPGTNFSDVAPGAWYAAPVNWAVNHGIVQGLGDGRFNPNGKVTREQVAVMLRNYARYVQSKVYGETSSPEFTIGTFPDGYKVSSWAKEAMCWAVHWKILAGSGGNLVPQGTANRAQVATILVRADDLMTDAVIPEEPGDEQHHWVKVEAAGGRREEIPAQTKTVTVKKPYRVATCNGCGLAYDSRDYTELIDPAWDISLHITGNGKDNCTNYHTTIYLEEKTETMEIPGGTHWLEDTPAYEKCSDCGAVRIDGKIQELHTHQWVFQEAVLEEELKDKAWDEKIMNIGPCKGYICTNCSFRVYFRDYEDSHAAAYAMYHDHIEKSPGCESYMEMDFQVELGPDTIHHPETYQWVVKKAPKYVCSICGKESGQI